MLPADDGMPTDDDSASRNDPEWVPGFPTYVRMLAVCHVLSLVVGPAGFFLLMAIACFLGVRRGAVDETVISFGVAALLCPLLCSIYRVWFVNWGRKHWPDGKPTAQS